MRDDEPAHHLIHPHDDAAEARRPEPPANATVTAVDSRNRFRPLETSGTSSPPDFHRRSRLLPVYEFAVPCDSVSFVGADDVAAGAAVDPLPGCVHRGVQIVAWPAFDRVVSAAADDRVIARRNRRSVPALLWGQPMPSFGKWLKPFAANRTRSRTSAMSVIQNACDVSSCNSPATTVASQATASGLICL